MDYFFGVRITPVSPQSLRRLEEVSEAVIHATRGAVRPAMEFLESHGKGVGHALNVTETLSGTDRTIVGGLAVANLVLGASELSQSYNALCQGDKTRGYLNAAGGSASIVGGLALGYAAASGSALLGPLSLANLGAASSAIAAMADGLEDVVVAHRAGNRPIALGLGGLKIAAGGVLLAGAMTSHPGLQATGSMLFLGAAVSQHVRAAFSHR